MSTDGMTGLFNLQDDSNLEQVITSSEISRV